MTTPSPRQAGVVAMAAELRAVLDQLAAAMARGDADAVLATEPALQAAVAGRPATRPALDAAERALVRHEVAGARAALARCRVLGAGAAQLTEATLAALDGGPSYGRQGAGPSRGLSGRGLKARG